MQRREVVLGLLALSPLRSWAQQPAASSGAVNAPASYPVPGTTLRVMVPFPKGSLTDVIARLIEEPLARRLDLRVVVEHATGTSGQTGAAAGARAQPDGYTLLAVTLAHAAQATLLPAPGHDLQRDLRPVALLASSPIVAVVPASSRIRSGVDLLGAAKSGRLTASSGGNGTPGHLALALLKDIAKTQIAHLPHTGAGSPIDTLLAGRADLMFADLPEALPHVESGRLRALAVASVARQPRLPDVPTTTELGLPTLLVENWTGLMAPVKTPDLIVDKLDTEIVKVMLSPEVETRATAAGLRVDARPAGKFAAFLDAEVMRWKKLIGSTDIRAR